MKNKIILLISVILFGLICSCGQKGNSNQQSGQQWEMGAGDSDDPEDFGDVSVTGNNNEAVFKAVFGPAHRLYLFLTTPDGNNYYTYDDEVDYADAFFAFFIVNRSIKEDSDIQKYSPYLNSVYNIPNLGNVPTELKERFLEVYYMCKDRTLYRKGKSYGYQAYDYSPNRGQGNYVFARYKNGKMPAFDDVPDNALVFYFDMFSY
ncbi:MAG: hypothetical protein IKP73_08230 [Bacteroidales bacterium]|nr:hypothetical protein [Bacteroidales bacterium]